MSRRNTERIFVELLQAALPALNGMVFPGPPRPADEGQDGIQGAVQPFAVFLLERAGLTDVPFIDGGGKGAEQRPGLTVWVRSPVRDYDTGKNAADDVFAAIDKNPPTADGFFEARCEQSAPVYLGPDDAQSHLWSINVALKRYKPSQF